MSSKPVYLLTAAIWNIGKRLVSILMSHSTRPTLILPTRNASRARLLLNVPKDERLHLGHCKFVKHLMYISAAADFSLDAISQGALRQCNAGHVIVKFMVEAKLRYGLTSNLKWTVLVPTLFFTSNVRGKANLLENGFFHEPLGSKGVSRADPADVALGVANALVGGSEDQKWTGRKVMIGSKQTYTASQVAALWSKYLGRKIAFAKSDTSGLRQFEEHYRTVRSAAFVRDMRHMYAMFEQQGFGITEQDYDIQVSLLAKEPNNYELFIATTAEE